MLFWGRRRRKCIVNRVQFNGFPDDEDDKKTFFFRSIQLNCWAELHFVNDWNWWELWRTRKVLKAFINRKFCTMHNFVNFHFPSNFSAISRTLTFRMFSQLEHVSGDCRTCPKIFFLPQTLNHSRLLLLVQIITYDLTPAAWNIRHLISSSFIWCAQCSFCGLTSTVTCVDFVGRNRRMFKHDAKFNILSQESVDYRMGKVTFHSIPSRHV